MPLCCRCNGNGRCRTCRCVRSGSVCLTCLPLRQGHCENCKEPEEDLIPQPVVSSVQHDIDVPSFSEDESELLSSPDGSAAVDDSVSDLTQSDLTLPTFVTMSEDSHFVWGDVDGNSFSSNLDQVYNEIVH